MSHDSRLEPILRAVEPAVRLVPERHYLQVLHYLTDGDERLPTDTDLPLWVSREDVNAANVFGLRGNTGTEPRLLLITDPNDRMIERLPREEQLRVYWRVLYEAAIIRAIDQRLESGELTPLMCAERLNQFGGEAAREVRYVLESEHLADPEADDAARYRVFAALYLSMAAFKSHRIAAYFPSLPSTDGVKLALAADVDAAELFTRTRPTGAAEPTKDHASEEPRSTEKSPPVTASNETATSLLRKAQEAERNGNDVRAAILRTQAVATGGAEREVAENAAQAAVGKLVDALGDLFAWNPETRQEWRHALDPLLSRAAKGVWPRAARCLYELQTLHADGSRDVYAIDLPEAIRTFGRRPVKRRLPHAQPVLILMHLKKARTQLLRAGLPHEAQVRLDHLFHEQIERREHDVRRDFTPIIVEALSRAGLVPANVVEDVARDKLVAELLDRVCDRGYLRIGDLRDAVARNRLKIADLAGPRELLSGDALLLADTNLAYALDGVYRRGEFYLRWIQRFSALLFGTPLGRLATLFVLLPFGGAFLTLTFAEEMRHIGGKVIDYFVAAPQPPAKPAAPTSSDPIEADEVDLDEDGETIWIKEVKPGTITSEEVESDDEGNIILHEPPGSILFASPALIPTVVDHHHSALTEWGTIISLGVFLLLMIHVPPFRQAVLMLLAYLWLAIRGILWDIPMGAWRSRTVRTLRRSWLVRFLVRHFWSPLLLSVLIFGIVSVPLFLPFLSPRIARPLFQVHLFLREWWWAFWAGLTLAYNTPWGWVIQDRVAEAVSDWWRIVRVNLIPGLVLTIIDWFRMLANWIERKLYAVDEWFRYRGGDSQGSLAVKAILGLLWFPIAYVFRFAFYLLVEPQINPIKHFPVVTVSHKMLLPLVVSKEPAAELSIFGEVIAHQTGWGVAKANFWAFWIIAGVPGIFGFMAWEFVANWQMYRANRPRRLRPVMLGSHGETMRGLLRPAFHSGTVPKLYRKLRHASRAKTGSFHHDFDHVAEAIERFAQREFVDLLTRAPEWSGLRAQVAAIQFGCQRIRVELAVAELGTDAFALDFENMGGCITATVQQLGWVDKLTEAQRAIFVVALRGLLDMAAVDRVDGHERTENLPLVEGMDDLARRVTWAEWVSRWERNPN